MYEELVKRLRTCGNSLSCNKCKWRPECDGPSEAMRKAADAIEELSRRIERAVDLYNRNVEKTAIYEALIGLSPEPPKEDT